MDKCIEKQAVQCNGEWRYVTEPKSLVSIAVQHGVPMSVNEAAVILNYMEGHDYTLMTDGNGRMVRHDNQFGNGHWEDQPYSLLDAARFCLDMNEDLLREPPYLITGTYEEYVRSLHEDEHALSTLLEKLEGGQHEHQNQPV